MLFILKKEGIKLAAIRSVICLIVTIAALVLANLEIVKKMQGPIKVGSITLTIIAVISALYAFCMLSRAFTSTYQRNVIKYLKENTNVMMEQIEVDFFGVEHVDKFLKLGDINNNRDITGIIEYKAHKVYYTDSRMEKFTSM